ncbi:hypothetical protein G6N74_16620 [Mesorhizobium sp. CGMCC 1.15528]|uniref:Uncharacterized protein n=1 Tax=Mesorhizobium zhangyense TaxID=1776730 RepID=A0A7C9R8J6_9HYPH|nr:hypothetical protein [Mesorhizobium zhangyense]NGN42695.1 hypothetical protein [Mesorhizobium zhangyense]
MRVIEAVADPTRPVGQDGGQPRDRSADLEPVVREPDTQRDLALHFLQARV